MSEMIPEPKNGPGFDDLISEVKDLTFEGLAEVYPDSILADETTDTGQ